MNGKGRPNKSLTNATAARVCIELDVLKPLKNRVWIGTGDAASSFLQDIYYPCVPQYCTQCSTIGHAHGDCRRNKLSKHLAGTSSSTQQKRNNSEPTGNMEFQRKGETNNNSKMMVISAAAKDPVGCSDPRVSSEEGNKSKTMHDNEVGGQGTDKRKKVVIIANETLFTMAASKDSVEGNVVDGAHTRILCGRPEFCPSEEVAAFTRAGSDNQQPGNTLSMEVPIADVNAEMIGGKNNSDVTVLGENKRSSHSIIDNDPELLARLQKVIEQSKADSFSVLRGGRGMPNIMPVLDLLHGQTHSDLDTDNMSEDYELGPLDTVSDDDFLPAKSKRNKAKTTSISEKPYPRVSRNGRIIRQPARY